MKLCANYNDEGLLITLEGDTIEEIASQLPEGERTDIEVRDEQGTLKGWVWSRDDWRWK